MRKSVRYAGHCYGCEIGVTIDSVTPMGDLGTILNWSFSIRNSDRRSGDDTELVLKHT
jgi:hypothetical protein